MDIRITGIKIIVCLVSKIIMQSTELGINFLVCRCNVLNDITRNHIAEHICDIDHTDCMRSLILKASIYLCNFCHYN